MTLMFLLLRKQSALTDFPPFHPVCVCRSSKQHRVFVWEEPLHVCGQRVWRVYLHPSSVAVWRGQRLRGPQRRGWMQWVHHSSFVSLKPRKCYNTRIFKDQHVHQSAPCFPYCFNFQASCENPTYCNLCTECSRHVGSIAVLMSWHKADFHLRLFAD